MAAVLPCTHHLSRMFLAFFFLILSIYNQPSYLSSNNLNPVNRTQSQNSHLLPTKLFNNLSSTGRMNRRTYHNQRTLHLNETYFQGAEPTYNLVCKTVDEKHAHRLGKFIEAIRAMWHLNRNTFIRWTGARNLFIVEFQEHKELYEVQKRTPWYLRGGVLVMTQPWNPSLPPEMHNFTTQKFVIRMRLRRDMQRGNIPFAIASEAGVVQKIVRQDKTHFLATILVKVREPLVTFLNITLFENNFYSVWFEYQKFPYAICKKCFVLDHSPALCRMHAKKKEAMPGSHLIIYDPNIGQSQSNEGYVQREGLNHLEARNKAKGKNPISVDAYHTELRDEHGGKKGSKRVRFVDDDASSSFKGISQTDTINLQNPGLLHAILQGGSTSRAWNPQGPIQWNQNPICSPLHIQETSAQSSSQYPTANHPNNQFEHQDSIIRSTIKLTIDDLFDITE